MAEKRDTRPELMPVRVHGGWAVQALAHNGDSAWIETDPMPYPLCLATMLGICASGEYVVWEPSR